jgi:hypothetical protein
MDQTAILNELEHLSELKNDELRKYRRAIATHDPFASEHLKLYAKYHYEESKLYLQHVELMKIQVL